MTPHEIELLERIDRRGKIHGYLLYVLIAWVSLLTCAVFAQEPGRVMRPDRAVAEALSDAQFLAQASPEFALRCRWVMVNAPDTNSRAVLSFAANTALLFAADPWRPLPLNSGAVFRLDLAEYAGYDPQRLALLLDTWDRMTDTQFYLPTDQFRVVKSPRYARNGKIWDRVSVRVVSPAAHADANGQLTTLIQLTRSSCPIISLGQFLRFSMNTDFGGLYAEFRQFDLSPAKGTDEEAFLARADVDLDKLGERNADQRVLLVRQPTAGVGFIEAVPTAGAQVGIGPTATLITRDYFAGDVKAQVHPFENLLDRKHDATEIFLPTAAGGIEYALFDGAGKFVRSAPLNPPNTVAADRTIPAPFAPVLQGPSGCVRCHVLTNPDTRLFGIFQRAPNYITHWRNADLGVDAHGSPIRWDVYANQGRAGNDIKRLVSLFKGEFSDAFPVYGRTYAKFVFNATGMPFEPAVKATLDVHDAWLYSYLTPRTVMLELGYACETEEQARQWFNRMVPFTFEPNRIMLVRSWTAENQEKLTRDDWLQLYPEVALRLAVAEAAVTTQAQGAMP